MSQPLPDHFPTVRKGGQGWAAFQTRIGHSISLVEEGRAQARYEDKKGKENSGVSQPRRFERRTVTATAHYHIPVEKTWGPHVHIQLLEATLHYRIPRTRGVRQQRTPHKKKKGKPRCGPTPEGGPEDSDGDSPLTHFRSGSMGAPRACKVVGGDAELAEGR